MSLIFTPLATDNFTPNADPLNPAFWTVFSDPIYGAARANSGKYESDTTSFGSGLLAGEYYSAISLPANQYISVTLSNWVIGNDQEASIVLRSDTAGDNQYNLNIFDNSDGINAQVSISTVIAQNLNFLYNNNSVIVNPGDTFIFAIVGTNLYGYHNGSLFASVSDSTYTSGVAGLYVLPQQALSDCEFSTFVVGSVSGAPTPPGGLGAGVLMGNVIIDFDSDGFAIPELQIGTLA